MSGEVCGDNRFELIDKYKRKLIEATNIEASTDEMAVLDEILFRFWQVGWLHKLELTESASDLIDRKTVLWLIENGSKKIDWGQSKDGDAFKSFTEGLYWMIADRNDIPSVEPEWKTGRWIKPTGMMPPEYHGHYECSECGAWAGRPWHRPWSGVVLSRHCPGCGIKMENANEE